MCRFPTLFPTSRMLICGNHLLIRLPEIGVTMCPPIKRRNLSPQFLASGGATVANHKGHHLSGLAAKRNPDPAFLLFFEDERPKFIQLQVQLRRLRRLKQSRTQCGEFGVFFFNQTLTVLRETPKTRSRPRKELRSSYVRKIVSRSCAE